MRTKWVAFAVLFLPSLLMIPVENRLHQQRRDLKHGLVSVTRELRDEITQNMVLALLAGFRGVVADFLWIESHGFWERHEWMRQYRNIVLVATLQPRSVMFWELGHWHMAWNIGYAVRSDPKNRNVAEGIKREREWHLRARDFLLRGIANVPDRYELYFALGWLYQDKLSDPCRAAEYFGYAARFQNAPSYISRMQARSLEKCGELRSAYEHWRTLWGEPEQARSIVERELKRLEDLLSLPDDQRVFPKREAPTAATP